MLPRERTTAVYTVEEAPVVKTTQGLVQGRITDGIHTFYGIPYAQAERFTIAKPHKPWSGVMKARTWGSVCPELQEKIASDDVLCPHHYWRTNEHCQYLNLWTPSVDSGSRLPVVVWMHGGGWVSGSSVEQYAYDGENFARRGELVFVNFNNRQNCLGALDLSAFGEEFQDTVFCGLSDVICAMQWIHENIAAFGGDPDNVTVIGQAGGAKRALALMQSPAADGLYHKMAVGSCAGEKMTLPPGWTRKSVAQKMGQLVVEELGLDFDSIHNITIVPYDSLARAVKRAEIRLKKDVPDRFRWEPIPDHDRFYSDPFSYGFRKETKHIPMMTGSSFSEMQGNSRISFDAESKNKWNSESIQRHAQEAYGQYGEEIVQAFKNAWTDHPGVDALFFDRKIRRKLSGLTQLRANDHENIWNWMFDLEFPIDGGTTAWHCSETPFILHNAKHIEAAWIPGVSERVQDQMADSWIAFAKNGDPNTPSCPEWPKTTGKHLNTMVFGKHTRLMTDHDTILQRLAEEAGTL